MLTIITAVSLISLIVFLCLYNILNRHDKEGFASAMIAASLLVLIIGSILLCMCGYNVSKKSYLDEQIEMYELENAKIEQDVASAILTYCTYEKETVAGITEKINSESSITLVAAYPELYSSMLVKEQINIYMSNREQIKELKSQKLQLKVYSWWLYFGN